MKNHYLPSSDKEKATWLTNFNTEFAVVAAGLGFTAAEIAAVAADSSFFSYLVLIASLAIQEKEEKIKYKQILADGPIGHPLGALPAPIIYPAAPPAVTAGVFPRIGKIVQRVKNHPSYTDAIGKALGIIGAEQAIERATLKPVLKLELSGGIIKIIWFKGQASSLHIEIDRGDGAGWVFLANSTQPDYLDKEALPDKPAKWSYRAMYQLHDEMVGQWSDVVSIVLGK